jgi:D,D-heptose 1,7-bisphosphate phosphatase
VNTAARKPAVFFDRDGVLNIDHGYVARREDFQWVDGAIDAVKTLNKEGWFVFIATNQSGIARGFYKEEQMHTLHDFMKAELSRHDAYVDDIRFCPYHAEGTVAEYSRASDWRKPGPGMILDLMKHWPVNRVASVLIGDKDTDIQAAEAAGIRGLKFSGGNLHDFVRREVLGQ